MFGMGSDTELKYDYKNQLPNAPSIDTSVLIGASFKKDLKAMQEVHRLGYYQQVPQQVQDDK